MSQIVTLSDLSKFSISPGVISWIKLSGRPTVLFNTGDVLDHSYLEKFESTNKKIEIEWAIDKEYVFTGILLFEKLKEVISDKDREIIKKDFILYIKDRYWEGSKEGDFLDLMMIIEGAFSTLKKEQVQIFNNIHIDMYKRLLYMASLNTIMAFTTGYLGFNFLKEVFHISFCFDLFIKARPMPDQYFDLLDQARYSPKVSFEKLELDDISNIESFFKGLDLELVEQIYNFEINAIKKLFQVSRERIKTGGFPLDLCEDELSDLEKIIIMNQEALTYRYFIIEKDDGASILKNILISNLKNDDAVDVSKRIIGVITSYFEGEAA